MSRVRKRKPSSSSSRGGRSITKSNRGNTQRSLQMSKPPARKGPRGKRKRKKKKRVLRFVSLILVIGLVFYRVRSSIYKEQGG